ncbi:hypothetical protein D9619_004860 [Psilocybe cf. subviscida]|uniref:DUF6593 domain-containing protein n=1 Tax=Psilocybe cf. subviscida TaxID=2480587 RepID=A0A8H5F8I2_9AGAR|nr:hypothetical protein D9619_004860 [Psilocybe cf. subviscida]
MDRNQRQPPSYDFTSERNMNASASGISNNNSQHNQAQPPDEEVVLTWNNGAEVLGAATAVEAHLFAAPMEQIPVVHPLRPPSPAERPPEYIQAQRPREKVTYTFSPLGSNSMVLLPPADAQDTRPQYFISVAMNCFMPLSHITTIHRGANEYAPRVGEFEMGIMNAASSRVQMGNRPSVPISTALVKNGPRESANWKWQPRFAKVKNMSWDYGKEPYQCRAQVPGSLAIQTIATFTSHMRLVMRVDTFDNSSKLEVFPSGQQYFDEIILSLLIVERRRLTPKTKNDHDLKYLFNY